MIEVGKGAPAFTLANADGKPTRLEDYAGQWVVLYFYPKDDTSGCTTEACDFTAGIRGFTKMNAIVVGVSPDGPESHRRFIQKYDLKVSLLSDPDKKVMEKYGAWGKKSLYGNIVKGVIRSTVLIDPDGKVAFHWPNVRASGHADRVKEKLDELAAAAKG